MTGTFTIKDATASCLTKSRTDHRQTNSVWFERSNEGARSCLRIYTIILSHCALSRVTVDDETICVQNMTRMHRSSASKDICIGKELCASQKKIFTCLDMLSDRHSSS
ncbi:unnamed protein product [Albugo candida]|uniref:Uncharacterized protein n=1 Tax=Albugo candida TaxID=65357 RepID=A0A024G6G3_9STRA|nr:unnamed protein product [Albugo candida]|eukprot:CCI42164.1 unnamed protein product [Albugo candida]